MISIVEYEPKFKSHFESLNRAWIEKYFYLEPRDEYVLKNPEEAILQKGGTILFALYNEVVVVGVVALIKIDSETYEFAKMGVDENFRRRGIAEALSQAAFKKLKSLKARKLMLFSNTLLEPAIRLYRKLGFTEVTLDQFTDYRRSNIKMELLLEDIP
jgi:ribosomal protein S18 acetylase RimI-like enzyme